jgi:hypothetical protein
MIQNQFKYKTRLGSFANTVGRQPLNVDVGNPLTKLSLRLQYTCTNSAAAPVGILQNQALRFLQRVELVVNGSDTVWSISPWLYASRIKYERHGVPMKGMETALNQAANGVSTVDITIPLHFDLLRGRKRNDAAIDLRGIRVASLYATFGSVAGTDLWTTPNAPVISNVALTVEGEYIANCPATDPKGKPIAFLVRQLDEINQNILGASNNFTFDIDQRTGVNVLSLATEFVTSNIGDDTGLINGNTFQGDIRIKSGGEFFYNSQANFIKADVRDEFWMPSAQEDLGFYFIDLRYDGKLTTGIPTAKLDANLQMIINQNYASGNTVVYVQREVARALQA